MNAYNFDFFYVKMPVALQSVDTSIKCAPTVNKKSTIKSIGVGEFCRSIVLSEDYDTFSTAELNKICNNKST